MTDKNGVWVVIDGTDGSGKTTLAKGVVEAAKSKGIDAEYLADPGSTELGTKLRELLLHTEFTSELDPLAEALLFMAARQQLVFEKIGPLLSAGKLIIQDRSVLSTLAYQGASLVLSGRFADQMQLVEIAKAMMRHYQAHAHFQLDLSVEDARDRISAKTKDRIERRGIEFFHMANMVFRDLQLIASLRLTKSFYLIDGTNPAKMVLAQTLQMIRSLREDFGVLGDDEGGAV